MLKAVPPPTITARCAAYLCWFPGRGKTQLRTAASAPTSDALSLEVPCG
jgi:hypothetical protein